MTTTFTTSEEVLRILNGRELLPAIHNRLLWTRSRLVKLDDNTTTPLLQLLAEHKFIAWDPLTHYPVWVDRDYTNESLENVQLTLFRQGKNRRTNLNIPHPAGTLEYFRAYRKMHPDKSREHAKQHREKVKKLTEAARQADIAKPVGLEEPDKAADKFAHLLEVLNKPKE